MAERYTESDRAQRRDTPAEAAQRGPDNRTGEPEPERIAQRAYQRFQERGGEHGHDQADWFAAEQELQGRGGRSADEIAGDVDARRLEESARQIGRSGRTR